MTAENLFDLEIITPNRVFYSGRAFMVEMNTTEGEIGVYRNHIPLTCILAPGIVTITEENEKKEAAVHAGFVEILNDKVTIMAEIAEWPDEIDANRAEEARQRAERRLSSNDASLNHTRAEIALHKALIRLEIKNGKEK